MNIRELDGKLVMPKTGKVLTLSPYQEEIINNLYNSNQNIYYRTRMGNSTALIYFLILVMKNIANYKICYIANNDETKNKTESDFEKYLQYNLKLINDTYIAEENTIGLDNDSNVTFYTADRVSEALKERASIKTKFDKIICENYVFSSSEEKELQKLFKTDIQYLLEN
jgi:Xaa-Pro aminopeptidase